MSTYQTFSVGGLAFFHLLDQSLCTSKCSCRPFAHVWMKKESYVNKVLTWQWLSQTRSPDMIIFGGKRFHADAINALHSHPAGIFLCIMLFYLPIEEGWNFINRLRELSRHLTSLGSCETPSPNSVKPLSIKNSMLVTDIIVNYPSPV